MPRRLFLYYCGKYFTLPPGVWKLGREPSWCGVGYRCGHYLVSSCWLHCLHSSVCHHMHTMGANVSLIEVMLTLKWKHVAQSNYFMLHQNFTIYFRISHKDLEYKMCQGCDWSWSWYSFSCFQCARGLEMRLTSTEPDSKYTHSLTSRSGCSGNANPNRNIGFDIGIGGDARWKEGPVMLNPLPSIRNSQNKQNPCTKV